MNICMISRDFLPNIGGLASHVFELSKALQNRGHQVRVITKRNELNSRSFELLEDLQIYRIYDPSNIVFLKHTSYFLKLFLYTIFLKYKIEELNHISKIDVIHTHTLLDTIGAILTNDIPVVQTEHTSNFLQAYERDSKIISLYKKGFKNVDFVIGPSNELVSKFRALGVPKEKTKFISNGVDENKFNTNISTDNEIKNKYDIHNSNIVLCPRRLDPKNGVDYLIKSIPYILKENDVIFLLVGSGSQRNELEELVSKLNINEDVIFTGRIENSKMPEFYALSDIVVLPSLKEATSIAGLEAMASGKPVVGTNVGGIPQIVTNKKTGLIVPPKDSKSLSEAINYLIDHKEIREKLGGNARREVENKFTWNKIAEKVEDVYISVI